MRGGRSGEGARRHRRHVLVAQGGAVQGSAANRKWWRHFKLVSMESPVA